MIVATVIFGATLLPPPRAQQTPASGTASQQPPATQTQKPTLATQSQNGAAKPAQPAPGQPAQPAPTVDSVVIPGLDSEKAKVSYAIGMNIGESFKSRSVDVDEATFDKGFRDALFGPTTLITPEQERIILTAFQNEMREKMQEKARLASETNKKEGDAFLEANKSKPGVVVLPSGLQYKILAEGAGPKPAASDTVTCNYRGTLIDGAEFDSSAKHGDKPATFPVSGVIRGWTEALQLMPVGSKWQLFVPSDLAYGPRGAGGAIGPNATLIFEIELVSIKPKPEPAQPATPPNPGAAAAPPGARPAPSAAPAPTSPPKPQ